MQDLTGRYPASLAPTSQEGGGMFTHPDHLKDIPIAPGSEPVTPMPGPDEGSQVPNPHLPAQRIPVSSAPGKPHVPPARKTAGQWAGLTTPAGFWKEVP